MPPSTILSNYLPIGETLLSPFPSPPAPKLALLICLNLPGATFDLPRIEKRCLLFQAVFSSLFQIDFGRVLNPNLPSKIIKRSCKIAPGAQNVTFWKYGVLPAWEHEIQGFRPPEIILNHHKTGCKDHVKETLLCRLHFH